MGKRFKVFMLAAVLVPVIAFSGCELFEKEKDNSSILLLLAGGVANNGTVDFLADGFDVGTFKSTGFGNAGGGTYQQAAYKGAAQFWIIFSGSHATGPYNQDTVDIQYYDSSGQLWTTVTGRSFTLTLSSWPGVGGAASGTFSGTLENFSNSSLTKSIGMGSFTVQILN